MGCIYFLFKIETGAEELESEDSDSESDNILNLSKITEMRLVPSDPNQCTFSFVFSLFFANYTIQNIFKVLLI